MKKRWELNGLIMRRKTETVKPLNPKLYRLNKPSLLIDQVLKSLAGMTKLEQSRGKEYKMSQKFK